MGAGHYDKGAVWNGQTGNVTTVGTNGGPSSYGAFDMSGNAYEWNDLDNTLGSFRGLRGGAWSLRLPFLQSTWRGTSDPSFEAPHIGFRLASPVAVPEPSTYAMAFAGLACGSYSMFRRRKRA
jgi:formylglycine-generating enzyme required for sulfatase activity